MVSHQASIRKATPKLITRIEIVTTIAEEKK